MSLSVTIMEEITSLSVDERLHLVEAIWESIADEPGQSGLTKPQKEELERRLAAHVASPEDVIPWEEVKSQALARLRG